MSSPLIVHLDRYDGPLDLLLDLIRKQQIAIHDIPIATITSQYLTSLDEARERDINIGAEFVYMAATLIHIKSKMLLPRDPELEKISPDEDPRQDLVERLIEHERYRNAAEMLQQKRMIEENVWSNPRVRQYAEESEDPGLAVSLFDLVKAFGEILERARNRPVYEVSEEDVGVPDMVEMLGSLLRAAAADEDLQILPLFERQRSVRAMLALFLAVLELVKRQAIQLVQGELFGGIAVRRHTMFDEVLAGGLPLADTEKDYR